MKKIFAGIVGMVLLYSGSALAQAEVQIDETGCFVIDGDGNGDLIDATALGGDAVIRAVMTPSGNSKITCNGTAAPAQGRAQISDNESTGFLCNTSFGLTADWHNVVTKSGRVSLTCYINGGAPQVFP